MVSTLTEELQHVIGGEGSGASDRERRNPADASDVVSRFPAGSIAETTHSSNREAPGSNPGPPTSL